MLDVDEATPGSSQQTRLLYAERNQQQHFQRQQQQDRNNGAIQYNTQSQNQQTQMQQQQQRTTTTIITTQQSQQQFITKTTTNHQQLVQSRSAQVLDQKAVAQVASSRNNFEVGSRHESTISSDKSIPEEIDDDTDAQSSKISQIAPQPADPPSNPHSNLGQYQASQAFRMQQQQHQYQNSNQTQTVTHTLVTHHTQHNHTNTQQTESMTGATASFAQKKQKSYPYNNYELINGDGNNQQQRQQQQRIEEGQKEKVRSGSENREAQSNAVNQQEVLLESSPLYPVMTGKNANSSTTRQESRVSTVHQVQKTSEQQLATFTQNEEQDSSGEQHHFTTKLKKQTHSESQQKHQNQLQMHQQLNQKPSVSSRAVQQNYLNSSLEDNEVVVSSLPQQLLNPDEQQQHQSKQQNKVAKVNSVDDEDLAEFRRLEAELLAGNPSRQETDKTAQVTATMAMENQKTSITQQRTKSTLTNGENNNNNANLVIQQQYTSNSQKTTPVDPEGGPRVTSKLNRAVGQEIGSNELLHEQIQYEDDSTPLYMAGQIHLKIEQFDSLEKSRSEQAALDKEYQDTGEGDQTMGIYHTASGKKQGVAVSQELQGHQLGDHGGLINIHTVRASEHGDKKQCTTIVKQYEEVDFDQDVEQNDIKNNDLEVKEQQQQKLKSSHHNFQFPSQLQSESQQNHSLQIRVQQQQREFATNVAGTKIQSSLQQSAVLTPSVSHSKKSSQQYDNHNVNQRSRLERQNQAPPNKVNHPSRRPAPTNNANQKDSISNQNSSKTQHRANAKGGRKVQQQQQVGANQRAVANWAALQKNQQQDQTNQTETDQQPSNASQLQDTEDDLRKSQSKRNALPHDHQQVYQSSFQQSMTSTQYNVNQYNDSRHQRAPRKVTAAAHQRHHQQAIKKKTTGANVISPLTAQTKQSQSFKIRPVSVNEPTNAGAVNQRPVQVGRNQSGLSCLKTIASIQTTGSMTTNSNGKRQSSNIRQRRSVSNRSGSQTRAVSKGKAVGGGHGKDKMTEIYERYGKVTQIDLSATALSRNNSAKRPSITVERSLTGVRNNTNTTTTEAQAQVDQRVLSNAIKQLKKSMRSESKHSGQKDRSTSRNSKRVARDFSQQSLHSQSRDLTQKFLRNSSLHQNLSLQQQQQNNTTQQSIDQNSLALPIPKSAMIDTNNTDVQSDTGTPSGAFNQTAGPLSSNSMLQEKLKRRQSSRVSNNLPKFNSTMRRTNSRAASKNQKMQDIYDRFRHSKAEDSEVVQKKAIRQLRKSFASERSRSNKSARDQPSNRSSKAFSPNQSVNIADQDLEDNNLAAGGNTAKNKVNQKTFHRTDTYDIYSNSAGAESQSNFQQANNQMSSTGHGSSITGTRRIDISNCQNQKLAATRQSQQLPMTSSDRVARQKALQNAPSPRLSHRKSQQIQVVKNKLSSINTETFVTSTRHLGSNKMTNKGSPKINQTPKKYISIQHNQSLKSINLKDRLTEKMVNNQSKILSTQHNQREQQVRSRTRSRRESTSRQRNRSVSMRQKLNNVNVGGVGTIVTSHSYISKIHNKSTFDLDKFKNYSNSMMTRHLSTRNFNTNMQRNKSMHIIAAQANRSTGQKFPAQQPEVTESQQVVRQIQQPQNQRDNSLGAQKRKPRPRIKVTGFFAATQQASIDRKNQQNDILTPKSINNNRINPNGAQPSGAKFSRATSNGRRMDNNNKPTNSITFGKMTNSSNRRGGELSRRSMSVTHRRGKELEDTTSPSRLSRIMSSRDHLGGEHNQHREGIETTPNQRARGASFTSMKNNRLLNHKTSILSQMSRGSHQDSQRRGNDDAQFFQYQKNNATKQTNRISQPQHHRNQVHQTNNFQSTKTKLKPAVPRQIRLPGQANHANMTSTLTPKQQLVQPKAALQIKSTKVGSVQFDGTGIMSYGIVKTISTTNQQQQLKQDSSQQIRTQTVMTTKHQNNASALSRHPPTVGASQLNSSSTSRLLMTSSNNTNQNKLIKYAAAKYQPQSGPVNTAAAGSTAAATTAAVSTRATTAAGLTKPGLLNKSQKLIGVNKLGGHQPLAQQIAEPPASRNIVKNGTLHGDYMSKEATLSTSINNVVSLEPVLTTITSATGISAAGISANTTNRRRTYVYMQK